MVEQSYTVFSSCGVSEPQIVVPVHQNRLLIYWLAKSCGTIFTMEQDPRDCARYLCVESCHRSRTFHNFISWIVQVEHHVREHGEHVHP